MQSADRPDGSWTGQRRDRWLALLGTILVLALATVVAARAVDLGEVVEALRAADPALLVAAVVAYACSWPLRGRRYDDVLAAMGERVGTAFATHATFLSQAANLALPARAGDGVRAYVCKSRRDVPYPTGAASLTVERAFDLLALAAVGAVGLLAVALVGSAPAPPVSRGSTTVVAATPSVGALTSAGVGVAVVATTAIGGCALAIGLRSRRRRAFPVAVRDAGSAVRDATSAARAAASATAATVAKRLPARLVDGARAFAGDLAAIARAPRALALVGAGSLAIWALDALTAVLVLAAVAGSSEPAVLAAGVLAVAGGNLAKVLPLTQGGLGLYEGAFAAVVVAASPVAGAVALAAAVLDHALKNGVTLAGGAIAAVALGVSLHRPSGTDTDLG